MLILAFDPSQDCTGYALLRDDDSDDGELLEAGQIRCKKEATKTREADPIQVVTGNIFLEVLALRDQHRPNIMAIEMPADTGRPFGGFKGRSMMSGPPFGMAVGAAVSAAVLPVDGRGVKVTPPRLMGFPSDGWAMNLGRRWRLRSTKVDKYKEDRVHLAARLYKRDPGAFGAKTTAGNVADAVLLARHCLMVVRSQTQTTLFKAGASP